MSDYNGWENYPTWNTHLWLTNDEGLYYTALSIVRNARNRAAMEDAFKDLIDVMNPLGNTATMFTDMLNWSISQINWTEIIDAFKEEIDEEESED